MRERFSSLTGPFCGAATKRRPQGRQRKVGVPAVLGPLRTTWVAEQRGQGGRTVDSRVVVFISSAYDYAAGRATTRMAEEDFLKALRQGRSKYLVALSQMSVSAGKLFNPDLGQIELVPASAKGVPTEVTVPVPVKVRSIVLLEGDALALGGAAATRDFRVMQHR